MLNNQRVNPNEIPKSAMIFELHATPPKSRCALPGTSPVPPAPAAPSPPLRRRRAVRPALAVAGEVS